MKHWLIIFIICPIFCFGQAGNSRTTVNRLTDINGYDANIDANTDVLMSINYEHHEIHAGTTFRVQHYDDAIASDDSIAIVFKVANQTKQPHFIFEWETEGAATVILLEGVTQQNPVGTDVICKNSNRNSLTTSILQGWGTGDWVSNYVSADTGITGGSPISLKKSYSSSKAGGSSGSRRQEIVLKPDLIYAVILINNEATDQGGQLRLEWYEHSPAN